MVPAALGGLGATGVDVVVLAAALDRGVAVAPAAFAGAASGAAVGFALGKWWAFGDRAPPTARQLARFGLVAGATAALMALAMAVVVDGLGAPYLAGKLVCSAAVFATWTYPAQRRFVFPAAPPASPADGLALPALDERAAPTGAVP